MLVIYLTRRRFSVGKMMKRTHTHRNSTDKTPKSDSRRFCVCMSAFPTFGRRTKAQRERERERGRTHRRCVSALAVKMKNSGHGSRSRLCLRHWPKKIYSIVWLCAASRTVPPPKRLLFSFFDYMHIYLFYITSDNVYQSELAQQAGRQALEYSLCQSGSLSVSQFIIIALP